MKKHHLSYWKKIPYGTISNGNFYAPVDISPYFSLYYDKISNQYYQVVSAYNVSNLTVSNFNIDIIEPLYFSTKYRTNETEMVYIADLNTNMRLYYKSSTDTYHVKILKLLLDNEFVYHDTNFLSIIITNKIEVFPVLTSSGSGLIYTNKYGMEFSRDSFIGTLATYSPISKKMLNDSED